MADTRAETLAQRIAVELTAAGLLEVGNQTAAERVVATQLTAGPDHRPLSKVAAEVAGYLGGVLVVAAAAVFVASQWWTMSTSSQAGALAASGLVLAAAAAAVVMIAGGRRALDHGHEVARRLSGVLLVGATGVIGAAVAIWTSDVADLPDEQSGPITGWVVMILAVLCYWLVRSVPGLLGLGAAALLWSAANVLSFERHLALPSLVFGTVVMVAAAVFVGLTETGVIRERVWGRIVAGGLGVIGAQISVGEWHYEWVGYLALGVVAAAGFALHAARRSDGGTTWPYLVAGVIGATLATTEAAVDFSDGAVGVAGALLIGGVVLLGASMLGLGLRRGQLVPR